MTSEREEGSTVQNTKITNAVATMPSALCAVRVRPAHGVMSGTGAKAAVIGTTGAMKRLELVRQHSTQHQYVIDSFPVRSGPPCSPPA